MAKLTGQVGLDEKIADILTAVAPQIAAAVREHLARLVGGGIGGPTTVATAKRGSGSKQDHTFPGHCIYPGCANEHKGPRWSFLCEKHRDISKPEKKKHLAAWKAGLKGRARSASPSGGTTTARKRKLTPAGRRRLSELMKARWAKKRAATGKRSAAAKGKNGAAVKVKKAGYRKEASAAK